MSADLCVVCGDVIPEGRHVCRPCMNALDEIEGKGSSGGESRLQPGRKRCSQLLRIWIRRHLAVQDR